MKQGSLSVVKVAETRLPGVLIIEPEIFSDHRGFQFEIYNQKEYLANKIPILIHDRIAYSKKNVLRGLHGDGETWKLAMCLFGKIFLVVVNYDRGSEYFGQWESFTLVPENGCQILIPPNYLNGHLVLSDQAGFYYKWSEYYKGAENQFSVRWNDPRFNIKWPTDKPELSSRDGG